MGHHCYMQERLELIDNHIYRVVNAQWKNKQADILKERFNDSQYMIRYLDFSRIGGYLVTFPGEKLNYYYGCKETQKQYDYYDIEGDVNIFINEVMYDNIDLLFEVYPQYKYAIKKIKQLYEFSNLHITFCEIFKILRIYNEHPEIEYFLTPDFYSLCLYKSIYKLDKKTKSNFIKYIKKYSDFVCDSSNIRDLIFGAKNNISPNDISYCRLFDNDIKCLKYIKENKTFDYLKYKDYKEMVLKLNHNFNDPYWKYPKDLNIAHNKVMDELKLFEENKNEEQEKRLIRVVERFKKYDTEINGYNIFIPDKVFYYQRASHVLNQCLMVSNYIDKVIKQKSIIVMIWKNDIPIATAEIDFKKQIHQFYADERSTHIKPSEEIQDMFNNWLVECKFRKSRAV